MIIFEKRRESEANATVKVASILFESEVAEVSKSEMIMAIESIEDEFLLYLLEQFLIGLIEDLK